MKQHIYLSFFLVMMTYSNLASSDDKTVEKMLNAYSKQGVAIGNAVTGKELWEKNFNPKNDGNLRSCASCHTKNLTSAGQHAKTGKSIKPMSPSVYSKRLSNERKIEKWFKRNCKWTMGRECSVQEKADFLVYINTPK